MSDTNQSSVSQIIVLGKERSGTKWLTNLIANHPDVACVQSEIHNGVLETNVFNNMPVLFGDLKNPDNWLGFLACFSQTYFFKYTGLDRTFLDSLSPSDYYTFFDEVMTAYAHRMNASRWIQKTNSLFTEKLLQAYPQAKFVLIQRGFEDNYRSSQANIHSNLKEIGSVSSVFSSVFGHYYANRYESSFAGHPQILFVRFEDLKSRKEETLQKVYAFLDLSFDPSCLEDRFRKNTSFTRQKETPAIPGKEKVLIAIGRLLGTSLPFFFLRTIRNYLQARRKKTAKFVKWTYTQY